MTNQEQTVYVRMRLHPTSPQDSYPACDRCAGSREDRGIVNLQCWHCGYKASDNDLMQALGLIEVPAKGRK